MSNSKRFAELTRQANMVMAAVSKASGTKAIKSLLARHKEIVKLMAACNAAWPQERSIVYTTKGDFTHLPACGIGFCRG